MKKTLMAFMDVHSELDALFQAHQEALIGLDLSTAKEFFEKYQKELMNHICIEEKEILPLYAERVPARPGATVEMFEGEHKVIKQMLSQLSEKIAGLKPNSAQLKQAVIDLLDVETRFKDVMAHHDLREKNMLYPELDKNVNEAERERLLQL